jgi:hypothetical protein
MHCPGLRLAAALCWCCLAGCATHADRLHEIRGRFYAGDVSGAARAIDKQLARPAHDADVLRLERAIVELADGRPQQAERTLREVRDRFDHLEQASLAESAVSALTDDNRRAYAGEDYEKVLIRALLAISNLMGDGQDAGAYALQMGQKQQAIIERAAGPDGKNPKLAYKRVAVGPYIHGLLREETHAGYDDSARAYEHVVSWQPDFASGQQDLQRAMHGRHSGPGHGVLYAFAFVGRGPYKEEAIELPSTVSLLIADRILTATGKHSLPPTIAPVKVPRLVLPPNSVDAVQVAVDGQPPQRTETVTDIGRLALEQYEAIYPEVLARAVVRRVIKKGVVYGVKEAADVRGDSLLNLALDVGGIAWEATEAADTRCWGLLPRSIQVVRIELPAGEHTVALQALSRGYPRGRIYRQTVHIQDGRNTYLLANFPASALAGEIIVGPGL